MRVGMVVSGIGLVLISSICLLTGVLGPALESTPEGPAYWSEVAAKMFALEYGGMVSRPAGCCLILGITLVFIGLRNRRAELPVSASSGV